MKKFLVVFLICIFVFSANSAYAFNLIRDDEIESYLKKLATPIFKAADLNPNTIKIYVINDDSINAFVTDGKKMFIHTALITQTDSPNMLMGVIAHETGHIYGGHLIKMSDEITSAILRSTLGYALGIGMVIAAGKPDVGGAIALGSQRYAERSFLKFSREQEEMADNLGLGFLKKNGYSAEGLFDLLSYFNKKQSGADIDPYIQTHPLSKERLDNVGNFIRNNTGLKKQYDAGLETSHKRVVAKIEGFLGDITPAKRKYKNGSDFASKYAMSIVYHRENNFKKSLDIINSLIKENPNDPYLNELKGQFTFESGDVTQSVKSYEIASKMLPNSLLINTEYAKSMLALEEEHTKDYKKYYIEAEKILKRFQNLEPLNLSIWKNLAKAYGKNGKLAYSYYAFAEYYFLGGDFKKAKDYIELSKKRTDDVVLKEKLLILQEDIKKKANKNAEF
jgi:predicted Zn-dependent protease